MTDVEQLSFFGIELTSNDPESVSQIAENNQPLNNEIPVPIENNQPTAPTISEAERVIQKPSEMVVVKKNKITTEAINKLFGIKESFELPGVLLKKLLDKEEKDKLCSEFMQFEFDTRNDCLRDYFQINNANRSNLKQDYTPDCLCKLVAELLPPCERIIDVCSGTGALSIASNKAEFHECEEISNASIPVLLFNLCVRGMNATVAKKDVIKNEVETVYKLIRNGKYSDVEIMSEYFPEKSSVIISNPPYSMPWEARKDERFIGYALPPKSKSDYCFVLDIVSRLKENGKAFVILPHGVLFRGATEGEIRARLLENNLIESVIGLPENLFLNTNIPVFILVISKGKQDENVLFIDGSKLFEKQGKQNVMTDEHIKKIVETYNEKSTIEKFSRLVGMQEIRENDYNLNIPRYVDTFEHEELPPLSEITKEIIKCELEAKKATKELLTVLKDLCGDEEYNQAKDEFLRYFSELDIVGETMCEWMELQQLEAKIDYIVKHAKKDRRPIYGLATFERVKKGKVYEAGTVYIQLSATDGKVGFLTENKELEEKYGVFIPKLEHICPRYLYYILDFEMEKFLARYQSGININPDIFKYLQVTYYPEYKWQKELVMTLDSVDYRYNEEKTELEKWQDFKKFHLNGMFPA